MTLIGETQIARNIAGMITTRAHQRRAQKAAKTRARKTQAKIDKAAEQLAQGRRLFPKCLCGRSLTTKEAIRKGVGPCCESKIMAALNTMLATEEPEHAHAEHDQVANGGGQDESRGSDQKIVALPRLQRAAEQSEFDQDRARENLRGQRVLPGFERARDRETQ